VLRQSDPDPWRGRLRDAFGRRDDHALEELARDPEAAAQPPTILSLLRVLLVRGGERPRAVELLRSAQQRHPDDFWINEDLGLFLSFLKPAQAGAAVRYLQAAVALRPDSPGAHLNLGTALHALRDLPGAAAEYRKALALKPNWPEAHDNLGQVLHALGDWAGAIAEYRKALALTPNWAAEIHDHLGVTLHATGDRAGAAAEYRKALALEPNCAQAHGDLGYVLSDQGDPAGAVAEFRKASELDPKNAARHYILGNTLRDLGDLTGATAEYRRTITLKPDYAEAHCNLGHVLRQQGELAASLAELRRGHELGSKNPRWPYPSLQWVRQGERLVELEGRLPDFLNGKAAPASSGERIELALLCQEYRKQYAAAARFYAEAFAAKPKLADKLHAHRYDAACAAVLAGSGQGKDVGKLDDKERARLRQQALDWLRADLTAWGRLLDQERAKSPEAVKVLRHWLADPDFIGVRQPEMRAKLPEVERQLWKKLWDDTAETLARAQSMAPPKQKPAAK
jgi:Flp pilus assembly protein TadD